MNEAAEQRARVILAEIDRLRADAELCEKMHTRWLDHDGELVEVVTVRRRWRINRQFHSERVMSAEERNLFLSWLYDRARALRAEADELVNAINSEGNPNG